MALGKTADQRKGVGEMETKLNAVDGAELVLVPAGPFRMGREKPSKFARISPDEGPEHEVTLDGFWIYRFPVTNAQFNKFTEDTGYRVAGQWPKFFQKGRENHPASNVAFKDAAAYCEWAQVRLPSEAQWEKAARGSDGRLYPWGDRWDVSKCNVLDIGTGFFDLVYSVFATIRYHGSEVDAYMEGASPYGCLDMLGNCSEWTRSLSRPYPYDPQDGREDMGTDGERVVRGEGWSGYRELATVTHRFGLDPKFGGKLIIGFRAVQEWQPDSGGSK